MSRRRVRGVALGVGVTLVVSVPLVVSLAADAADDVLLSRGRPAAASSVKSPDMAAAKAVDGDSTTGWASIDGAGTQWLQIDLGAVQPVNRVKLTWEKAFAKAYRIQTSADGVNFTTAYTTKTGDGGTDDLKKLSANGRYVRVLASGRGTSGGYALWEVEVYGPGPVVPKPTGSTPPPAPATGLTDPVKKEYGQELVSSAENSTLDWRQQFGYIEDIGDGRGYTGGIIGFCSGTSDMLAVVQDYTKRQPVNGLAKYLPALRTVDGSDSHAGLDPGFPAAWKAAAADPIFQKVQEDANDAMYFDPAVRLAQADGLRALGQFAYYDAAVMHGVSGMRGIRAHALTVAKTPAAGGDEIAYLNAFLDARVAEMKTEEAHSDTSRVDDAQRVFLKNGNLDLNKPMAWKVYGDKYSIK